MKSLLVLVCLAVVAIGGLGFYLGWFHIGTDGSGGKKQITFSVDQNKIKADENKALEKLHGLEPKTVVPAAQTEK